MFLIRDRKSREILIMRQSIPGESVKPQEIFPDFDPKTMEFGRSETPSIPAWFTIEKGIIKPVDPPEPEMKEAPPPPPSLDEVKEAAIAELSRRSFEERQKIIPDHQIQNAALGIYDEGRTQAIRDTTKAFRDEYHRLEAAVKKARSVKAVQAIQPHFPTKVEAAAPEPSKRTSATKEKGR